MFTSPQNNTMAILVREAEGSPPFADERFCRRLCVESFRYGLRIIVIPIPAQYTEGILQRAYTYHQKKWKAIRMPMIDLVMNRCLNPLSRNTRQRVGTISTSYLQSSSAFLVKCTSWQMGSSSCSIEVNHPSRTTCSNHSG